MFVETIRTAGLAHRSYLVGDGGEVAVVDPRLEPELYLAHARRRGARIACILETHRNEDYVSGALALAERTGAPVLHGRGIDWGHGQEVGDGDTVEIGNALFQVIETPGHTLESLTFALVDRSTGDAPVAAFTGDALFVGDVGRTDLLPDRAEEVAGLLYDSIHHKILPLGDHVVLYPAHGAGSVCGLSMADRDVSTLGYERRFNPMLQLDRAAFVRRKMAERHPHPPYFSRMERLNRDGVDDPGPLATPAPLPPDDFEACQHGGAVVVDVRDATSIAGAMIRGALALPLDMLPSYAGWFLLYDRDLILVCDSAGCARAAALRLRRIGYRRVVGYLAGGMTAWATSGRDYVGLPTLSGPRMRDLLDDGGVRILDVRKADEWDEGHLPGAQHTFLGELPQELANVPRDRRVVTFCASGVRSTIAASLLVQAGFDDVAIALGSMKACRAVGCPIVRDAQPGAAPPEPEPV